LPNVSLLSNESIRLAIALKQTRHHPIGTISVTGHTTAIKLASSSLAAVQFGVNNGLTGVQ